MLKTEKKQPNCIVVVHWSNLKCSGEMMYYDKERAKGSSAIKLYRIYFENKGKVNQTGTF